MTTTTAGTNPAERTAMPTKTVMPSEKTWNAILKLAQQGQACEKQIDDLEAVRADLKGKLAEMGLGTQTKATPEWKNTAAAFAEVELTLASERANLKVISRQSNKLITGAAQGKLFEDKEIDEILADDGSAALPLYDDAMRSAQAVGATGKVGDAKEAADAAKPDQLSVQAPKGIKRSKPTEDGWRGTKIADVDHVTTGGARCCQDVGLITLGDADRYIHADGLKLEKVPGLSPRERNALTAAIAAGKAAEPAAEPAAPAEEPKSKRGRKPAAAAAE